MRWCLGKRCTQNKMYLVLNKNKHTNIHSFVVIIMNNIKQSAPVVNVALPKRPCTSLMVLHLKTHCRFCFRRNDRDRGGNLSGSLEAAVVGERDAFLPCVHEQLGAAFSGYAANGSRAISGPSWARPPAPHLGHGECCIDPCWPRYMAVQTIPF